MQTLAERSRSKSDLPDFIIIGAGKSGTTSIARYLCRHPQITMSSEKEPQFFDCEYHRGEEWYRSLFAHSRPGQLCFEATTTYTYWPHSHQIPQRIADLLPNVRLIYIMRHPVDRSRSHCGDAMKEKPSLTFEDALEQNPAFIDASLYVQHIQQYLRVFDREQLLLLLYDDFSNDPRSVLGAIQSFIGVPEVDLLKAGKITAGRWGETYTRERINTRLRSAARIPGIERLWHAMPKALRTRLYYLILMGPWTRRVRAQQGAAEMLPETRTRLLKRYRQPTRDLERLLDRSLPHWFL